MSFAPLPIGNSFLALVLAGLVTSCPAPGPNVSPSSKKNATDPVLPDEALMFIESEDNVVKLNCPPGSTRIENPPLEQWCEKDATRHGSYLRIHEDGKSAVVGSYADGREDGQWSRWYENRNLESMGRYEKSKQQGPWLWWYENGNRKIKGDFLQGRKVGIWTEWHENGERAQEGPYANGRREGEWQYWGLDGVLIRTDTWMLDELVQNPQ